MPLAKKADERCSYKDYVAWPDDERWELIDGVAYNMSPAPSLRHQIVTGNLYGILRNILLGKKCRVFMAPTDVVLSEYNVVQPDILIVCDKSKMTGANINGAPDVAIEVLSPSTGLKDLREKKALYQKYGVKEYIIVDPVLNYVECLTLNDKGIYGEGKFLSHEDVLSLSFLEGINIALPEVFEVGTSF